MKKRILIKISGEILSATKRGIYYALHDESLGKVCSVIKDVKSLDYQIGIVIGGGNFFRGGRNAASSIHKYDADTIGMLSTVNNAIAVSSALENLCDLRSKVLAPFQCPGTEYYSVRNAINYLEEGFINFYAGGTGHGSCTTDYNCVLRAVETSAAVIKATKVDGVYDSDPNENKSARHYETISYDEYLKLGLQVMEGEAIVLAQRERLPIIVCKANDDSIDNIPKVLRKEAKFTIIQ